VLLAVDADSLSLDQLLTPAERSASPLWRRMGPWPWPRELQAELAAAVLELGARQMEFNVVFTGPSRLGAADDAAFERRLAPWRRQVVLAAAFSTSEQGGLARYPQVELAVLYGSRAIGRHRPASDIDLTLVGRDLDASTLAGIEADLDDLLLPWMIDLSSFSDLNHPPLLVHIERVGQVFYRRGELIQGRP
jgi:predicted nucleotidyltransferase